MTQCPWRKKAGHQPHVQPNLVIVEDDAKEDKLKDRTVKVGEDNNEPESKKNEKQNNASKELTTTKGAQKESGKGGKDSKSGQPHGKKGGKKSGNSVSVSGCEYQRSKEENSCDKRH